MGQREIYAKEVLPYLNSTPEIDNGFISLISIWERDNLETSDLELAKSIFRELAYASQNIYSNWKEEYIAHCELVGSKTKKFGEIIAKNYPELSDRLDGNSLEFAGLLEDALKIITTSEGSDIHEILTYAQLAHMGFEDLAEMMALHFVAPQMLEEEHRQGRYLNIPQPYKPSLELDILTSTDALCTTSWFPKNHGGDLQKALTFRIKDIRDRRKKGNVLIKALDNGGEGHLRSTVSRFESLTNQRFSTEEVMELYGISKDS